MTVPELSKCKPPRQPPKQKLLFMPEQGQSPCNCQSNSLMHDSLERAAKVYQSRHRKAWDDRVYHGLSTPARRQGEKRRPIWQHKPGNKASACLQCQKYPKLMMEEIEVAALLQDSSDSWSPKGWLQTVKASEGRWAKMQSPVHAKASCRHSTPEACCGSKQGSIDATVTTVALATSCGESTWPAAQLSPVQDSSSVSTDIDKPVHGALAAAEEPGTALQTTNEHAVVIGPVWQAPAAAHGQLDQRCGHAEASPEATAAAMTAWLIHEPALLQNVLAQLETFAAQADNVNNTSSDGTGSSSMHAALSARHQNTPEADVAMRSSLSGPLLPSRRGIIPLGSQADLAPAVPDVSQGSTPSVCAGADVQQPVRAPNQQALGVFSQADIHQQQTGNRTSLLDSDREQAQARQGTALVSAAMAQSVGNAMHNDVPLDSGQAPEAMCTLLLDHSCAGRYNEARALVKQGVPVDTCDAQGNTPLIISAREGHGRMVKLFVRKGANLEAHNIDGMSAEQLALSSGHIGIVEYLHESKIGVLLRR